MANRAEETHVVDHVLRMAVDVDYERAARRLAGLAGRFATLVDSIPDPSARAHGLDWTVVETAVHMWRAFDYYSACLRGQTFPITSNRAPGESFPSYFARENRAQIDAEPERDPKKIALALHASVDDFLQVARDAGPLGTATFTAGYSEDNPTSVCTLLCELIVHGYDIARSTGASWPVDRADAILAVYSTTAALPLALDEEAAANENIHVKIHLRGGTPFSIRIRDGRVWSEVTTDRPDVNVSADPISYLMVGFGRMSLLNPVLRGRLVVWGRRPWLMLRIPKLFLDP